MGRVYAALQKLDQAIDLHNQQLKIAREIDHRSGEADALGQLGNLFADQGEPQRAIEMYEQTLAFSREIGNRLSEASCLWSISSCLDVIGNREQAIALAREAMEIYKELGDAISVKVQAQLDYWASESKLRRTLRKVIRKIFPTKL